MIKTFASKNRKRAIMVNDDGIIKAYGLSNVLCCDAEELIKFEELEEVSDENFEWEEFVYDINYLKEKYNINNKQISDRFNIPYRTVQNWASGQRECSEYIVKMMEEIIKGEKMSTLLAIKKLYSKLNGEHDVLEDIKNDKLTENKGRNGRLVIWYLDVDGNEAAIYVDTLEFLDKEEIERELC